MVVSQAGANASEILNMRDSLAAFLPSEGTPNTSVPTCFVVIQHATSGCASITSIFGSCSVPVVVIVVPGRYFAVGQAP